MNLDLDELIKAGIIDDVIAAKIRNYYADKKSPSAASRLIQVVSIIGICLIGLGLILIIGYNWDQIPKWLRITIAFIPLAAAQGVGAFTIIRSKSSVWRESSALAVFFGIGIGMTLITQIYFLDIDMREFLQLWILLSIPLIYVFDSSVISLAVWICIGSFLTKISWTDESGRILLPLAMMIGATIPYAKTLVQRLKTPGWSWHHWIVPIVLGMFLFSLNPYSCNMVTMIYLLITCIAMDTLRLYFIPEGGILNNGYKVISFLGIWIIAFIMTFGYFWKEATDHGISQCFKQHAALGLPVFFGLLLLFLAWIKTFRKDHAAQSEIWWIGFILIAMIILGEWISNLWLWVANILVLAGSARMIYRGILQEVLPVLNLGILILAVWIICRFFEYDFSFLWRGLAFIALGALCFSLNYVLIKKRRT
ncbi:MAG: DUF2157 domain-containing protein [Saprospiraceae bacterium]